MDPARCALGPRRRRLRRGRRARPADGRAGGQRDAARPARRPRASSRPRARRGPDRAVAPWPALCRADVVITHGGLNAVAEVAAARKPAVVVPQDRPHGEQRATARALAQVGLAVIADPWPQDAAWPSLLRAARELGGA